MPGSSCSCVPQPSGVGDPVTLWIAFWVCSASDAGPTTPSVSESWSDARGLWTSRPNVAYSQPAYGRSSDGGSASVMSLGVKALCPNAMPRRASPSSTGRRLRARCRAQSGVSCGLATQASANPPV